MCVYVIVCIMYVRACIYMCGVCVYVIVCMMYVRACIYMCGVYVCYSVYNVCACVHVYV